MSLRKNLLALAAICAMAAPAVVMANDSGNTSSSNQQSGQMSGETSGQQPGTMGENMNAQMSSREQVRQAQSALKDQGFDVGKVDGRIGAKTTKAIRDFQKAQNLPVTGSLNQQTLAALGVSHQGMAGQAPGMQPNESNANQGMTGEEQQPGTTPEAQPSEQPGTSGTTEQQPSTNGETQQPGTSDSSSSNGSSAGGGY